MQKPLHYAGVFGILGIRKNLIKEEDNMKHTNRVLALLLSLALALSFALPAFAEDEEPVFAETEAQAVDWADFRIITQPQDQTVKYKESFTLSVEVNIPEGVEVEYQWYAGNSKIDGATESVLQCAFGDSQYPYNGGFLNDMMRIFLNPNLDAFYYCKVTGYAKDMDEILSDKKLESESAKVTMPISDSIWMKLLSVFIGPFLVLSVFTLIFGTFTMGAAWLLAPIIIPVGYVVILIPLLFAFLYDALNIFGGQP